MQKRPVVLVILDGFGLAHASKKNAISLAKTPTFDLLIKDYPHTTLEASGEGVGLPPGQMGGSEVGHMNIGAGRIVHQEYMTINKSIENKSFYKNPAFVKAMKTTGNVHLIGLLSDGGVHSHIDHLFALIDMAKKVRTNVFVHAFLDGRDTPPKSAKKYIKQLEKKLKGIGQIATLSGRFFAMDRDNRWKRTKKAYDAITTGQGFYYKNAITALKQAYKKNETDEFVTPVIVGRNFHGINEKDTIIFFNFRPDRARQLTRALTENNFDEFKRKKLTTDNYFVTMTEYDKTLKHPHVAFHSKQITNTLGEWLSKKGLKQLRVAETEKYAHVTYYFNSGREKEFRAEKYYLIPSPKVKTYDLKPEMSAYEITKTVIKEMCKYDFIVINYANPDMVGHTGIIDAAVKAIETVDGCIAEILRTAEKCDAITLITADHGNCECMKSREGLPETFHTINEVPFIIVGQKVKLDKGCLANIAPTILDLMNIPKPKEMTAKSLILK